MAMNTTKSPVLVSIDDAHLLIATKELTHLIRKVGATSVAGLILRHAQQELDSLLQSEQSTAEQGQAFGPFRIHSAA